MEGPFGTILGGTLEGPFWDHGVGYLEGHKWSGYSLQVRGCQDALQIFTGKCRDITGKSCYRDSIITGISMACDKR